MKLKTLLLIAALGVTCLSALGQQRNRFGYNRQGSALFLPNEVQLDLFGTYADRDRFGADSNSWGGGVGLNYFFTRYVGVMADTYLEEWELPYRANGSLVLRLPVDRFSLAPYVFGGGGRQWKWTPQWTEHLGGGLEIRLNPHTGIFADARRVFPEKTEDYTLVRFGLRFGF